MGISPPTFQFNEYFTPYLRYQIADNAKSCKKTTYLLKKFKEKLLVPFSGKLPKFIQLVFSY